jgi:hypothetical protein
MLAVLRAKPYLSAPSDKRIGERAPESRSVVEEIEAQLLRSTTRVMNRLLHGITSSR